MYIIDYAARAVGGDVVTVVGPCPADWHLYAPTGCCFYVSTTTLNHDDARAACQSMDADLASISDRAMADFVYGISSVYTVMQYICRVGQTRSSANAKGPRDASCQLKSWTASVTGPTSSTANRQYTAIQ